MISQIKLNHVTSYQTEAVLNTDKKVNLIYGLNGSGKSTLSNYLYETENLNYIGCSHQGLDNDCRLLVYNQRFIQEVFYQSDSLNGIFTLSKENKEIETKIEQLKNKVKTIKTDKEVLLLSKEKKNSELSREDQQVETKLWEIKTKYTGGDRVLEFCLKGKMGSKKALKSHIISISKPIVEPLQTVDELKNRAEAVNGENISPYSRVGAINFEAEEIEKNPLLQEVIVGNANSSVAKLIEKLEHSDWVRKGLGFISTAEEEDKNTCPFCQNQTITDLLIEEINNYFDVTYEKKISELEQLLITYTNLKDNLTSLESYSNRNYSA